MNTRISDAAVEAASAAYELHRLSGANHELAWACALDAALPHLQPAKPEAVLLRDELRERADAPDVRTSEGGRRFIAEFFARELRRNDFGRYITTTLAADFACALAQYLAARQPVGQEPFGWWMQDANGVGYFTRTMQPAALFAYNSTPGYSATPLHAAPTAQAVDLGQFRESVIHECLQAHAEWQGELITYDEYLAAEQKRDRLLALIDSGKAVQS